MTTIKPVLIVPVGTFQKGDMERLNDNFFCVVEAKDPAAVKFLDPIPSAAERTKIEEAAIILSRRLLSNNLRSFSSKAKLWPINPPPPINRIRLPDSVTISHDLS